MPILKNPKHEKFANLIARGMSGIQAYKESYPGKTWKDKTLTNLASRLRAREDVCGRIAELQKVTEKATIAGREELAEFLSGVVRKANAGLAVSVHDVQGVVYG